MSEILKGEAVGEQASPRGRGRGWLRGVLLAGAALVALILLGRAAGQHLVAFLEWVDGLGPWAPILFVLGYAGATVAFVPGSILTLAAGAVFGIAQGVAWVFLGALLGSTAAFLTGRYLARSWVEGRIGDDHRFRVLDRRIGEEGLKLVVLLRLTPIMPYNLLNYALGLTRVRLVHYVIGALGMLPGTLLYVYSGRVAGNIAAAAGGAEVVRGPGYWAILVLGLLATLLLTVLVTRMARAALREGVEPPPPESERSDQD